MIEARTSTTLTLFVYGTLKRGGRNHALLAGQEFLGLARTAPRYRLFGRRSYPCLIEDSNGYAVEGELWRIGEAALPGLDEYEGAPLLFERRPVEVESEEGRVFAYVYLGELAGLSECGSRWDEAGERTAPHE